VVPQAISGEAQGVLASMKAIMEGVGPMFFAFAMTAAEARTHRSRSPRTTHDTTPVQPHAGAHPALAELTSLSLSRSSPTWTPPSTPPQETPLPGAPWLFGAGCVAVSLGLCFQLERYTDDAKLKEDYSNGGFANGYSKELPKMPCEGYERDDGRRREKRSV
jgi:hypothetical protein